MNEEENIEIKPPYMFSATVYSEEAKQQLRRIAEKFLNDGYTVEMNEEKPQTNSYNHTVGYEGGRYLDVLIYDLRKQTIGGPSFSPSFLVGAQEVAQGEAGEQ